MKKKRGFTASVGHWVNSRLLGVKDYDDIQISPSFLDFINETSNNVFNIVDEYERLKRKPIDELSSVDRRLVKYIDGLFYTFDMKNERQETEKLQEFYKRQMMNYEMLDKLLHIQYQKCINDADTVKVSYLQEGIKYFPLMPDILKISLINALFGKIDTAFSDINFEPKLRDALIKAKQQEARSLKIENDLKAWRFQQNKNGL
ncbi:MAG TPA: hypothetical protein VIL99_14730 [Ignavibacteria bacterium]